MDSDNNMIDKLKFSSKKKNSVLSLMLIVALLTMIFLPIQESAAAPITDIPVGVNGRILPANLAGDTSDWIEIARNSEYSLIVRKDVLPLGKVEFDSSRSTHYTTSNVRNLVNNWFTNTLPSKARMRDFTVNSDVLQKLGSFASLSMQGYSKPTETPARTGNDVAFLLSFSEAASFCSMQYATSTTTWVASPAIAQSNFKKLSPLPMAGLGDFWWLRSPGHSASSTPCASSVGSHSTSMANMVYASSSQAPYPYVRPAVWVKSTVFETTPSSYSIGYVLNGGTNAPSNPTSYTVSTLPVSIAAPYRSGYAFSHWSMTCANGTTVVLSNSAIPVGTTGNVTLTAIWGPPIQYNITYNLNGGTPAAGNPTTYNIENSFTINSNTVVAPSMTGYKFMNWRAIYSNGTMFNLTPAGIPAGSTGDVLLAAMWDPIPIYYNITYILDGGVNAPGNPSVYTVASTFPIGIDNPSRSGYTFLGWVVVYSNGTTVPLVSSYSIPTGSAGNVTLTAVWSPIIQTFSIEYNLNGGVNAVGNPTSYSTNSLPLSIAKPSRAGYVFSYWLMECEGSFTALTSGVIPAGTVGNVRLTAVWTVAPTYTITYALNGGTNAVGNPTTYTTSSAPLNVADPSMSGYVFLYWIALYADGSLGVLPPSGIAAGTTGDITLIAVWYP